MYTKQDILNYHCPRWNELPDIELYMDQVVSLIDKNTAVFSEDDSQRTITKTMINNYVKQKKVKPPVNKRYDRTHLSFFMVVAILKRFMSLSEIGDGIRKVRSVYSAEEAYNLFCETFESSLRHAFDDTDDAEKLRGMSDEIAIYNSVTRAYAYMLYARYLIAKPDSDDSDKDEKDGKGADNGKE